MNTITEWHNKQKDYGMCHPPMDAQSALNFLAEYLDVPYTDIPETIEQTNTYVVLEILNKYSRKFRKEQKHNHNH